MKKEKRKILRLAAFVIALILLAGVMVGCMDRNGDGGSTGAAPAADGGVTNPTESENVTGTSENDPDDTAPIVSGTAGDEELVLTEEQIRELEDAGLRIEEGKVRLSDSYDAHDFDVYYGTFNGYAVFLEKGMLQALWDIEVAGFVFHGNTSFQIYACKGDEIFTLAEAYDNGLLTVDDIAAIAELYGGTANNGHEKY